MAVAGGSLSYIELNISAEELYNQFMQGKNIYFEIPITYFDSLKMQLEDTSEADSIASVEDTLIQITSAYKMPYHELNLMNYQSEYEDNGPENLFLFGSNASILNGYFHPLIIPSNEIFDSPIINNLFAAEYLSPTERLFFVNFYYFQDGSGYTKIKSVNPRLYFYGYTTPKS